MKSFEKKFTRVSLAFAIVIGANACNADDFDKIVLPEGALHVDLSSDGALPRLQDNLVLTDAEHGLLEQIPRNRRVEIGRAFDELDLPDGTLYLRVDENEGCEAYGALKYTNRLDLGTPEQPGVLIERGDAIETFQPSAPLCLKALEIVRSVVELPQSN